MKKIVVLYDRCISCRACEIACGRKHRGVENIRVVSSGLRSVPIICYHCENPPCMTVCYRKAIYQLENMVILDPDKCTGCGLCSVACPFGAIMTKDGSEGKPHKCDLCIDMDGAANPRCVATCPSQALIFTEINEAAKLGRRRAFKLIDV